ncbi:hypothetical protein CH063_02736 [Colletotrichum higginsianum]|uniref:Uncharacterized protein n=1 Tax=Colletotrichum higginsianum (strain IMI 349063) TaxID=759273 RepID=H1VP75_COLHI|nr:hypothetical protein CH063_02736 [Colletotrichum higginsianum]
MMFSRQSVYQKLDSVSEIEGSCCDSDDRGSIYQPDLKSRYYLSQMLPKCALFLGVVFLASIPGLASLKLLATSRDALPLSERIPTPITQCGSSPEEARRLGCRFEMHNFAWVPPQCYDDELGDDWDSHADWVWSRSPNNSADTDEQFMADCRAGNVRTAWLPWYQHMAHCDIIMKK